jgi:hypothetical protein
MKKLIVATLLLAVSTHTFAVVDLRNGNYSERFAGTLPIFKYWFRIFSEPEQFLPSLMLCYQIAAE